MITLSRRILLLSMYVAAGVLPGCDIVAVTSGGPQSGGALAAPSITLQPQSTSVSVGSSATFTVVAQGTQPLIYQWLLNGAPLAGATSAAYTLSPALLQDNSGTYSVIISNSAGRITSQTAVLDVT